MSLSKINLKLASLLTVCLFFSFKYCWSQEYHLFSHGSYWITQWDIELHNLEKKQIIILMDSSVKYGELKYSTQLAKQIVYELTRQKVNASYMFLGQSIPKNSQVIKFKSIPEGRVKLTIFAEGLPNCRRFEISEGSTNNENSYCPLVLSLNKEKEGEAIKKASKRIAKLIIRNSK